jgi:hypothetical protein
MGIGAILDSGRIYPGWENNALSLRLLLMRIPEPLLGHLLTLQSSLLAIVDECATVERALFAEFGETSETLVDLAALQSVLEDAQDSYRRLANQMMAVARQEPERATASINLLLQTYERGQNRLAAAWRSIQEIKDTWGLP